ncbi:MAG: hypothetical protein Q9161_008393 [Pseudevernia consocians]
MNNTPHWPDSGTHTHSRFNEIQIDGQQQPQRKLRASCDGCYSAKLKCTKQRPTCPRCVSLGLVCRYSPSQRTGKPRRRNPQQQPSRQPTPNSGWGFNVSNDPQSAGSSMSHSQAMVTTSLQAFEPFQHASKISSAFRDRLPSASPSVAEDEDLLGQWSERLTTGCNDSLMQLSEYFTGFPDGSMTGNLSISHLPMQKHPAPADPKACDCFDFLLQALHVMQTKSLNPHSLALDTILSDSKNMISRGEALLNCSCSENGTLIMLLASLVAEHLSFLQAATTAASAADSGSPTTTSTATGSTTASTPNSENQATASYASRLTIGNYMVDREDEARLRIEIILMELQKTNAFLAKFKAKVARLRVGYESQTYEGLVNVLCTRLREATIRLQKQKVKMNSDDGAE